MDKNKVDKAAEVIMQHIDKACFGIFDTRNVMRDDMTTLYNEDGLTVDICYDWEYFEVFGLTCEEFAALAHKYNVEVDRLFGIPTDEEEEDD